MDTPPPATTTVSRLSLEPDAKTLARLRRKACRLRRTRQIGLAIALSCCGLIASLPFPNLPEHRAIAQLFYGVVSGCALVSYLLSVAAEQGHIQAQAKLDREQQDVIAALVKNANSQTVGFILERIGTAFELDTAEKLLITLLPRLKASDAHLLNAQHHRILSRILKNGAAFVYGTKYALCLAILKAYEQVGNAEDLLIVEQLAAGTAHAVDNLFIQQAAQDCLPYLRARLEQQTARQTLLRASSASAESGESLLRPAQSGSETEPRQLLRAAPSEPPDSPQTLQQRADV